MTHRIIVNLTTARQLKQTEIRQLPKPTTVYQKAGLRYERKVRDELKYLCHLNNASLEYNPWFRFFDFYGAGDCVPDMLIHLPNGMTVIVEVKLTFTNEAIPKLRDLYAPVVELALNRPAAILVIARNLTTTAPRPRKSILNSDITKSPLIQWLGHGHILWQELQR